MWQGIEIQSWLVWLTEVCGILAYTNMNIGIVGHEAAKFTKETEQIARGIIRGLVLATPNCVVVSGGCHLGGIDIWAEEEADKLNRTKVIFKPNKLQWEGGYKQRNLKIAEYSDIVHCIVVSRLPDSYRGRRFAGCYHCLGRVADHVKSGGCWTAWRAKERKWHVI